jgi:trans-aconitate methyltransferase
LWEIATPHLTRGQPVVDVGCGNGNQARWLNDRWPAVVGVDASAAAVERARDVHGGHVRFQILNILDASGTRALAEDLGPANVLVRFVLHLQSTPEDRAIATANVRVLTGGEGTVVNLELVNDGSLLDHIAALAETDPGTAEALDAGLRPGHLQPGELAALYENTGLRVIRSGHIEFKLAYAGHTVPAEWVVARQDS